MSQGRRLAYIRRRAPSLRHPKNLTEFDVAPSHGLGHTHNRMGQHAGVAARLTAALLLLAWCSAGTPPSDPAVVANDVHLLEELRRGSTNIVVPCSSWMKLGSAWASLQVTGGFVDVFYRPQPARPGQHGSNG